MMSLPRFLFAFFASFAHAEALFAHAGPLEELLPHPKHILKPGQPESVDWHRRGWYRLEVRDGKSTIDGDAEGRRSAESTLSQLKLLSGGGVLPSCVIIDGPTYLWRGFMHDCGRNFLDVVHVKKVIDLMALYKLNVFHWHLTDYYGWRLESRKYPMLQAPWAFGRHHGRYYTQEDFKEVVAYAGARGIMVVPELDVPGHTLAFRRGLGIDRMSDPRVKDIVCELIDELCSLADRKTMPFVHLGTDEARQACEQVPDDYCPAWAARVVANGRKPVGWTPGKSMMTVTGEKPVRMVWQKEYEPERDEIAIDTVGCYFGGKDPLTFLNAALSINPCAWDVPEDNKLGVEICSWHDDYLGEDTSRVFTNCNFAPAVVFYSDMMWNGNAKAKNEYAVKLPSPGGADFQRARTMEDVVIAHRDKVVPTLGLPFSYVRQTQMRWRISDREGKTVARDVAQASIMISDCGAHRLVPENSYLMETSGLATVETWIECPTGRTVGAWIGFTRFGRSGGRRHGTPRLGEWGRSPGIKVEINDRIVQPPDWRNPGLKFVSCHPEEPTSDNIAETEFTNEEYFMREPTPAWLDAGWNHVKLTVPKHIGDQWNYYWTATFVPVSLGAERKEIMDLKYSSEPQVALRPEPEYDVVIYGSTPAALTAAIEAGRLGRKAVVVSPETRIGGMTTGGLGQTDIGNKAAFGGLALMFYQDVAKYYQDPANWTREKMSDYSPDGQCFNSFGGGSMWTFEPHAALAILEDWERRYGLKIFRGEWLDRRSGGVVKKDGRIVGFRTLSGKWFRGKMFIDATYEGDLLAAAGVSYFVGRESNSVYGETINGNAPSARGARRHNFESGVSAYVREGDRASGLLPGVEPYDGNIHEGDGDCRVQAYCFRMCNTDDPDNRIPFRKPTNYREKDYELLFRNMAAVEKAHPGWRNRTECWFGFPWINSRMPNRKTDSNNRTGFSTDFIGRNWKWPEASYEEREKILREHLDYQMGLMWTLANHPRIPARIRREYSRWGMCKDEFLDGFGDGWQRQLYVREGRRMIGEYVMTEANCRGEIKVMRPVALGAYGMDSHHVRRCETENGFVVNEGNVEDGLKRDGKTNFGPYQIEYGALIPKREDCRNLLVPVCLSASHVAYGSIRMEPVFFSLGQVAGAAAVLSAGGGLDVQDLPYAALRDRLRENGQVFEFAVVR